MDTSVWRYRHLYGTYSIRLEMWTRVMVNRGIGRILDRDLSLVVS